MARLLIVAHDREGVGAGQHLKGDTSDVQADGFRWGKEELSDKFIRVDIDGAAVKDFADLLIPIKDGDQLVKRRAIALSDAFVDSVVATGNIAEKTKSDIEAAKVDRSVAVKP